jgi:hypothetical protein
VVFNFWGEDKQSNTIYMSAKAGADSTKQKPEKVEPKKLSPCKQRRKEDRDPKFNRTVTDTSISADSSQLEDPGFNDRSSHESSNQSSNQSSH